MPLGTYVFRSAKNQMRFYGFNRTRLCGAEFRPCFELTGSYAGFLGIAPAFGISNLPRHMSLLERVSRLLR